MAESGPDAQRLAAAGRPLDDSAYNEDVLTLCRSPQRSHANAGRRRRCYRIPMEAEARGLGVSAQEHQLALPPEGQIAKKQQAAWLFLDDRGNVVMDN